MTALVLRGDARHLPLPDESVDLIVTSPPYFALRSYTDRVECYRCYQYRLDGRDLRQAWRDYDAHVAAEHKPSHYGGQIGSEPTPGEYIDNLIGCTREWVRVLKLSGSLWVNLGDKYGGDKSLMGLPWRYALRCIDDLGLILRAEVIWAKANGLPESVRDRVRRSHEQWFHFVRQPRYFAAVDEIRTPAAESTRQRWADPTIRRDNGYRCDLVTGRRTANVGGKGESNLGTNPLGALPGSVWTVVTQPLRVPAELGVDHFAAFPMELPRRIILGWSSVGGVVLDPFGGTGTTSTVAKALGRVGITVDRSADYCRLARWRTNDPGQLAAALEVERPPKQVDDQLDLFAEVVP